MLGYGVRLERCVEYELEKSGFGMVAWVMLEVRMDGVILVIAKALLLILHINVSEACIRTLCYCTGY